MADLWTRDETKGTCGVRGHANVMGDLLSPRSCLSDLAGGLMQSMGEWPLLHAGLSCQRCRVPPWGKSESTESDGCSCVLQ